MKLASKAYWIVLFVASQILEVVGVEQGSWNELLSKEYVDDTLAVAATTEKSTAKSKSSALKQSSSIRGANAAKNAVINEPDQTRRELKMRGGENEVKKMTMMRKNAMKKRGKNVNKGMNKKKGKVRKDGGKKGKNGGKKEANICGPENVLVNFGGAAFAMSAETGTIQLSWNQAIVRSAAPSSGGGESSSASVNNTDENQEACEETILYYIFVAEAPFDYSGMTLQEISGNGVIIESYKTRKTHFTIKNGLENGKTYSVLVLAQVGMKDSDIVSSNRNAKIVRVAEADPLLRSDVQRIVSLNDESKEPIQVERLSDTSIKFYHSTKKQKKLIESFGVDDWITGDYQDGEPFIIKLEELLEKNDNAVVWKSKDGTLADIFARLMLDVTTDTVDMYLPQDSDSEAVSDVSGERRHLIFDIEIKVDETDVRRIRFSFSGEVGILTLSVGVDFDQIARFSVDIEGGLFGLDKFDLLVEVEQTLKGRAQADFKRDTSNTNNPDPIPLWTAPPIRRIFPVGGVPVYVSFHPALLLVYESRADLEVFLSSKVEYTASTKNTVTFTLEGGWQHQETSSTVFDGDIDIGGRAVLEASVNLRLQIGILIYGTAWVAPFAQFGPYLSIEATSMPVMLASQPPLFYFSKCEFGAKAGVGITAEFRRDIPFFDEQEFKLKLIVERPFLLLTLPSASLSVKSFDECVDDDAIKMIIEASEGTYTATIPNSIKGPTEFLPVFNLGFDRDEAWEVNQLGEKEVELSLKRAVIESQDYYKAPEGHLYYQTRAEIPFNEFFTLLFDQEMDELSGIPGSSLDGFECCEDEDCELKYGESVTCEDHQCGTSSPTMTPTAPTSSPTTPPIAATSSPTTSSPTRSPAPTPEPTEDNEEEQKDDGGAYGDPHLFTFDGRGYSCQAKGEFWLTKSLDSDMEVQGRFQRISIRATFTTAVVARSSSTSPIVEFSISEEDGQPSVLRINGQLQTTTSYQESDVRVDDMGSNRHTILFADNGLQIDVRRVLPSFPHFFVNVRLPLAFRSERLVGLLGSPNDNPLDDWTDFDGNVLEFVSSDRGGFDYCTLHWCIRNETESLFTYSEEFGFDNYTGCDDTYGGDIDTSSVSNELRALCGTDVECLIDGIELGLEAAQNALDAQAVLIRTSRGVRFRFQPTAIQVGPPVNVQVTVNLTNHDVNDTEQLELIDRFNLYRTDAQGTNILGSALVALLDTGIGVDQVGGDFIFTAVLAVQSLSAGESFHFLAIPVINNMEVRDAPVFFVALNAILSFSQESGIGVTSNETEVGGTIQQDSIDGLILVVAYTWPADQPDLDTGTIFLDAAVGFGCGSSSNYLEFSGDDTSQGGSETVRVLLGDSYNDGRWVDDTVVEFHAGWYGSRGQGPASVVVYTEKSINGTTTYSNAISFAYMPGRQTGCSTTDVGAATIEVLEDDSVIINILIAQQNISSTSSSESTSNIFS